MSNKGQTPYPTFTEADGSPLDAGYVFIGVEGKNPEVYPIPVFWDENLSIPAAQPIRTRNGFLSKFGMPGKFYISYGKCSITIKNKKKQVIYSDLHADLSFTQTNFEEKTKFFVTKVASVAEMLNLDKWEGRAVTTESYYEGLQKGGNTYYFDPLMLMQNNGGTVINGWVSVDQFITNAAQWGAYLDGITDDTHSVETALNIVGEVQVFGKIKLDRFDFPKGAKISGNATINYSRNPDIQTTLNNDPVNFSNMKAVCVFGVFDICEMLQIKTAGFNTIIHYGYSFSDGGTMEKAVNAAEGAGLNVIINSPNDVPPTIDLTLGNRNCVLGFYLFDEPQHNNISLETQNVRIAAWRNATDKLLCTADNGIFGFENQTISPNFDIVFADCYYIANDTDERNKMYAAVGWSELLYKCSHAKVIPCVGLFSADAFSDKDKNIAFAKDFFKFGDGSYATFAWDSSRSDPSQVDIISDIDLYQAAKYLNFLGEHKKIVIEYYVFGPKSGLSNLMLIYNNAYSSANIKPFSIVDVGSSIDERHQNFSDKGIAVKKSGGLLALNQKNNGFMAVSLSYRNWVDAGKVKVEIMEAIDDFFTTNVMYQVELNGNTGFTQPITASPNNLVGIKATPLNESDYFFKFLSGAIINSSWLTQSF